MDLSTLLNERFGHPGFREGQQAICAHVSDGDDALVVMPTGAGKSLCYQLPALARGGTTLVVSPLIALMKDQVDGLVAKGIRATGINSTLTLTERRERMAALRRGEWELVYVAPERFTPAFLEDLKAVDIRLLAIDEAHCLSQWGHDFRPDYLRLGQVRVALGCPPTVALTATATPKVQDDIVHTLGLEAHRRFIQGFDRPNLVLEVQSVSSVADKEARLPGLVQGLTSLVYCATRKNVERAVLALRQAGVPAEAYHAGIDKQERSRVQDAFMQGRLQCVCATNAFGMGVDKDDVRSIVHWDIPGTVEAYYQEIGRAGRDGLPSRVTLLYNERDRGTQEFFIKLGHPPVEHVHAVYERLLQERENPVWIARTALGEALPDDAGGERTASSCLYVLQREGWVLHIRPADRPGRVVLRTDAPQGTPRGLRGQVLEVVQERLHENPADGLVLHPERLARALDVEREQLVAALRGLEDRGYIRYRPPERIGGVELLRPNEELQLPEKRLIERRQAEYQKLDKMMDYGGAACRRRYLLEYFGEKTPFERCGTCDGCRAGTPLPLGPRSLDAEEELIVRKTLSCVARMKKPFSPAMIARVLIGSRDRTILAFHFDRLTTWGLLSQLTQAEVEAILQELVRAEALFRQHTTRDVNGRKRTYAELSLTEKGARVMMQKEDAFTMVWPQVKARRRPVPPPRRAGKVVSDLLVYLKEVRRKLAEEEGVPAYVVASNRTLEEMSDERPMTRASLLEVHGWGPVRMARYGQPFLDAMQAWGNPE